MSLLHRLLRDEIVRRYVVVNSFDGVLTALGIIFAEFFAGIADPRLVILPGMGTAIALFISGSWSAYAAERSEMAQKVKDLEKHLLRKIESGRIIRENRRKVLLVSLVNGLAPAVSAMLVLSPFFMVAGGLISLELAYYTSMALSALLLFLLGAFTGYMAEERVVERGLLMLAAALVIGVVFYALAGAGML